MCSTAPAKELTRKSVKARTLDERACRIRINADLSYEIIWHKEAVL
jgi:hypothetical protein